MSKMEEIRKIQEEIDHRTNVEKEAERLIASCKFKEAMDLLEKLKSPYKSAN